MTWLPIDEAPKHEICLFTNGRQTGEGCMMAAGDVHGPPRIGIFQPRPTHYMPLPALSCWTQKEPKEAGSYWMRDGSADSLPAHVEVFWSGTDNRCFVPRGQYGWTRHQDMDELKGYWWHKLACPPLPNTAP